MRAALHGIAKTCSTPGAAIRWANVSLRVGTLGTRFALIFVLAKYLNVTSVAYYGLFTAAVGYALLCVGLDFYVYTTRQIIKVGPEQQGRMLKSQAAAASLLYLAFIPIALWILPYAGLPQFLLYWFVPILILEHLNQEIYRLLIVLSHQLSASLLLFLRQGSWALALVALMVADKDSRNLFNVMSLWTGAGIGAAVIGLWKLRSLGLGGWHERIDWPWIRKGIAVSGAFIIATLALRGIQTFDRYWLESLAGIEIVGAYVLFFGIASALSVFLDAAIFSFSYPELVRLAHRCEYELMQHHVRRMTLLTVGASIAFIIASTLLLPILLRWIGQDIYIDEIDLYYWIIASAIFLSLSMIPHYALYSLGNDRLIITSHIASFIAFAIGAWAFSGVYPRLAVPISVLIAMMTILVWKSVAYFVAFDRVRRNLCRV